MNLVLLHPGDWIDEHCVLLQDRRAHHLRSVLKSDLGDSIRVGLWGGCRGEGVVEAIDDLGVRLSVRLDEAPPARHPFDLVLSLPRPKMLRRILRITAEYGVQNLHLINSARVEKSFWQSPLLHRDKLDEALCAGMEQARDTIAPNIHLHQRFRPFVEDQLSQICAGRPCWIAHVGAAISLADAPRSAAVVMIGPEGGFVPFEVDLAEQFVAQRVHLGERILSVDTALTTVLAQAF